MKIPKKVRLSSLIIPLQYVLTLQPDLKEFKFAGEESITVEIKKSINSITLHSKDLFIESVLIHQNKKELKAKSISFDTALETVTFTFPEKLTVGKWNLAIQFKGELNDKMLGFYRSKYEVNGKEEYMAVTQLESTHARWVFPCFDEPAFKATFSVSLIIPKELTAISNTIEERIEDYNAISKIVRFVKSPQMSTYLLAFIVGKFEYLESKTKEGTRVRVFVTPGKKKLAAFALETGVKILSFYTDYFKVQYPLPVMDMIAIPDFAAGAMENWGAVTYRETALLVDPVQTAVANKQRVALVIAHELAHQWFGNLVTMQWWTDLWLNEGFASFIEFLAIDSVFPKWNIWDQFIFSEYSRGLELDGLKNTHPIEVEVHHPDEINEIFDSVSYSKGASIIRMLEQYLGRNVFRKGLQQYLKKHAYSNTTTENLWEALEFVSKKPVKKIMKNWTQKSGYPLVTVENNKSSVQLSQQRFLSSPLSQKQVTDTVLWNVPLFILQNNSKEVMTYLMSNKSVALSRVDPNDWVKINANETSFIRVKYSDTNLKLLQVPIREKRLATADRFGILRDSFALSESGYSSTVQALDVARSYIQEDEFTVWAEMTTQLHKIENLISAEPFVDDFKSYAKALYAPIAKKLGWNKKKGESEDTTLLRSIALYNEGHYGDSETISTAKNLFQTVVKKKKHLDSNLHGLVYALVAENGGEAEYKDLMMLYEETALQEEKDRIFRALCSFPQKHLLQKSLDFSLSDNVRAQDAFKAVHFVFANPHGKELAWNFVQEKWDTFVKKFAGSHLLVRFVSPAESFVSEKKAHEVEAFFQKHKTPGVERTIAQVLEQIRSNALWLKRDKTAIGAFLKHSSRVSP